MYFLLFGIKAVVKGGNSVSYLKLARELAEIKRKTLCMLEYKKMNMTNSGESVLLYYLKNHNNQATPVELSKALGASTARVAVLINKMEKKGMVERKKHPNNNRNVVVYLLPLGRKLNDEQENYFNSKVIDFFETLEDGEAEQFVKLQRKMLDYIIKLNRDGINNE